MSPLKRVQPAMTYTVEHLDEDLSLRTLAHQAGISEFHLHRVFSSLTGERPKQFTLRLRLSRAAALLLTTRDPVIKIALDCGFQSHEVFCRAFRKCFGITPSAYRARGFAGGADPSGAMLHAKIVASAGPCIRLFHIHGSGKSGGREMTYSVTKKQVAAQPVLVVKRRVKPLEIAATLGEAFGQVVAYAQKNGIALVGQPFTRYVEWGPGLLTIEAGLPVSVPGGAADSQVRSDILPGGLVAATTHRGSYEDLSAAHAAVQQWIEGEGLVSSGAPWESYTTDPADYPDPKDWRTEVVWPVRG